MPVAAPEPPPWDAAMIEVRQSDIARAMGLTATWADLSIDDVAAVLAAHRQQAEDAMKERCAKAESALRRIAARKSSSVITSDIHCDRETMINIARFAIRGIDAGGEGEA
jgi:hypothetical protein